MAEQKRQQRQDQQQVVVITGASSGIGRATAHEFARRGARIALLARGREGLEAAAREVQQLGGEPLVLPTDVADAQQVAAAAAAVDRQWGPVDVWVNDAAVVVLSPVKEMTADEFKRVTEVSYLGVVYGTLEALKRMLPRNRGAIIQIGSALSYRGIPLHSAYCAAQHAIQGFCESLRTELEHDGSDVHVTMVRPSGVNTPLWEHCFSRMPMRPRPIGRMYQPEVVARAIVWASQHRRPELSVGWPAVKAIFGNRYVPRLADWDLARSGIERQQTEQPVDADRPHNLWQASPGDPGIHGPFDDEAHDHSTELWASTHRGWLALAGAALTAAAAVGWMSFARLQGRWNGRGASGPRQLLGR